MSIKISYSNLEYQTKYEECRKNLEAKIWIFLSCSPCAGLRHMANIIFAVCLGPGTRQRSMFAVCLPGHTANKNGPDGAWRENHVRRVPAIWHTTKIWVHRVPDSGTRQTMTAVRPLTVEFTCKPRDPCSPCACGLTHGETAPRSPCARAWHTAKSAVAVCFFVCRVFSCRHTANPLFAVCPIKCTQQRFWHTAN